MSFCSCLLNPFTQRSPTWTDPLTPQISPGDSEASVAWYLGRCRLEGLKGALTCVAGGSKLNCPIFHGKIHDHPWKSPMVFLWRFILQASQTTIGMVFCTVLDHWGLAKIYWQSSGAADLAPAAASGIMLVYDLSSFLGIIIHGNYHGRYPHIETWLSPKWGIPKEQRWEFTGNLQFWHIESCRYWTTPWLWNQISPSLGNSQRTSKKVKEHQSGQRKKTKQTISVLFFKNLSKIHIGTPFLTFLSRSPYCIDS